MFRVFDIFMTFVTRIFPVPDIRDQKLLPSTCEFLALMRDTLLLGQRDRVCVPLTVPFVALAVLKTPLFFDSIARIAQ